MYTTEVLEITALALMKFEEHAYAIIESSRLSVLLVTITIFFFWLFHTGCAVTCN